MKSRSMTRRLTLWLCGATLLVWISVAAIAVLMLHEAVNELYDRLLELTAKSLAPGWNDALKKKWESEYADIPGPGVSFERHWTARVVNRHGEPLMEIVEKLPKPFPDAPLSTGPWKNATYSVYTLELSSRGNFLQLAEPVEVRRRAIAQGAAYVFIPILVLLPFSIAVCLMVMRRSLAPIEVLRQEIGWRDGGNLSPMGLSDLPAEFAPIAATVDRLLERLRRALDAEREFAANSAHELRTPIAGALGQTQRLVAELSEGPAKGRARGIQRSLSHLGHLVDKLLQLARAESAIGITDDAIDLNPMVRLIIEDFAQKPKYAGRLILDAGGCVTLMRKVDVDAFAILLRNLIENALVHGLADTPITVSVRFDGTIAIANAGPVVPLPDLGEVTKRFRRGATLAAGSGLGLHIVNMIIQRIGASLELASPARGREDGFEAIIRLPR